MSMTHDTVKKILCQILLLSFGFVNLNGENNTQLDFYQFDHYQILSRSQTLSKQVQVKNMLNYCLLFTFFFLQNYNYMQIQDLLQFRLKITSVLVFVKNHLKCLTIKTFRPLFTNTVQSSNVQQYFIVLHIETYSYKSIYSRHGQTAAREPHAAL